MLLPMGLPEGVNCIGFGLSLERPTMIKYKIDNIRKRYFSFVSAIYDRVNYEIILKRANNRNVPTFIFCCA